MISANNPPLPQSDKQEKNDPYAFAAEPKSIDRKRFDSNNNTKNAHVNIMHDRRIHRGNTYAAPSISTNTVDPIELQKQEEARRRLRAKRKAQARLRTKTPDAVEGRVHIDVQTDLYLEELSDKVPEAIAATQTDNFLNRAPSPLYIPQKSGTDVATQILEGELFDFDLEVQPILEVIVGKTLEQALMEVNEEKEMELLRQHKRNFEDLRNAAFAEVQRLEDAERRRTEEKSRRIAEQKAILKEKKEAAEKVAARAYAKSYLQGLIPTVFENLATNGYFIEKVRTEVDANVLPWLSNEVDKSLRNYEFYEQLTDDLIKAAVRKYREIPPTSNK